MTVCKPVQNPGEAMSKGQGSEQAGGRRMFGRAGIANVLFAIARPRDAGVALLADGALELTGPLGSRTMSVADIDALEVESGWRWGRVRVETGTGARVVSGLSRRKAADLAAAVRDARLAAWRRTLGAHRARIESIDARLAALSPPASYVRRRAFAALVEEVRTAAAGLPRRWPDWAPRGPEYEALEQIRAFLAQPEGFRERGNDAFLTEELERSRDFLDRVEARPLTEEQRRAVCVDDDRNLVIAAAGSGKTSVMVAKAGWTVVRGDRHPAELLLLAFARNAREELGERLVDRIGDEASAGMNVRTFHGLGLAIMGAAEGRKPALSKVAEDGRALAALLDRIIEELLRDREHGRAFIRWLAYRAVPYRSEHEFASYADYWDYVRSHELRTLQGERVKSLEECLIANFLYLNGVAYEYEPAFEHDTATPEKVQYKPDFHLTEAGIYIEHFALSADGTTPPFIDQVAYTESRAWKLRTHERYGTTLVETFSYEQSDGRLTEKLGAKLEAHGVALKPIPRAEIFALLNEQRRVKPFTELVATFLAHFKGSRLPMAELARRAAATDDGGRSRAFVAVFRPIFERYEATLAEAREIDFHDMINRATDHVVSGRYRSGYRYILVDEFQDISPGRAALVEALLDQVADAQLFAVGDDWQAINRFAGADIAIMREFHARFGDGAGGNLETTFRCSEGLSAVATRFVLANPDQIAKNVRTTHRVDGPGVWIGFGGDEESPLVEQALGRISADAGTAGKRMSVLLLGRYQHLAPDLRRLAAEHPDIDLSYRTVHGAKGLEADYVVVLGVCAGRYGFPTEMTDDPLLELVLARREAHSNAEERRLLYVAVTRARRRAYVLSEGGGPRSAFVEELLGAGDAVGVFGEPPEADALCAKCGKGRLVGREGPDGGRFYGCSYFPYCEYTEPACPACGDGRPVNGDGTVRCGACGATVEKCPRCDGWLEEIDGRYGPFLGCTKYPVCDYRRDPRAVSRSGVRKPSRGVPRDVSARGGRRNRVG